MQNAKKRIGVFAMVLWLFCLIFLPDMPVYAVGDGNMNGGGGGFGSGTSTNKWVNGDDGVRVTIVKASDGSPASASIDLTNREPTNIVVHFKKTCKTAYRSGAELKPNTGAYTYYNPSQSLPTIVSSTSSRAKIEKIKSYFTDEQVLRGICSCCGFQYDKLVGGEYKLLVEPLAFVTFLGKRTAMTATEAALYDRRLGGTMQSKMPSLSHKNLPLSIFLEESDLGFPVWTGSRSDRVSNDSIISALGIGIVRFNDLVVPELETEDYKYRVDTDVITSVYVSGGESTPDNPIDVVFKIMGTTYTVTDVYYPEGGEQIVWVKWHTPPKPQKLTINVSVRGHGSPVKGTLTAKIVDLEGHDPPNPTADDRKKSYAPEDAVIPSREEKTTARWSVWGAAWHEYWVWHSDWVWVGSEDDGSWEDHGSWVDEGWWIFTRNDFDARLSADMRLTPDQMSPTATSTSIKSGYGVNVKIQTHAETSQRSAVTEAQTAVSYFPEFYYKKYWRILEPTSGGMNAVFEFRPNEYSTYERRTHFTPIWMKDGKYTVYTYLMDCWTPDGMLSLNLTDDVTISGNLWQDWHIAPKK